MDEGQTFEIAFEFPADEVRRFAARVGDPNRTHQSEDAARASRFETVIVSGAQLAAELMGRSAGWFGQHGPSIALAFDFEFRKAVPVDTICHSTWEIENIKPARLLRGDVYEIRGALRLPNGRDAVRCRGRILLEASGTKET